MHILGLFWTFIICEIVALGVGAAWYFYLAGHMEEAALIAVPIIAVLGGTWLLMWYSNELKNLNREKTPKPGVMIFLVLIEAGLLDGFLYGTFQFSDMVITAADVMKAAFWLVLFFFLLYMSGISISKGYHLLCVHKAFKCKGWLYDIFGVCGALALAKLETWKPTHLTHHGFTDAIGDPHSPHNPFTEERHNAFIRFLWAHMAWMWFAVEIPERFSVFSNPHEARVVRWQKWLYIPLALCGFLIPYAAGGLDAFFFFGCIRAGILFNGMCSVNSLGHMMGERIEGVAEGNSRNSRWVSLCTLSFEGKHAYHHLEPNAAVLGRWDLGKYFLFVLERLGIIYGVHFPQKFSIS